MSGSTGAVSGHLPALGGSGESAAPGSGAGTASHQWPFVSRLDLGSLPGAVPCARLHTKHILREWGLAQLADDAETIVSELVTNALKASWSLEDVPPIGLRLLADRERLMIEVWDALSAPPDPRPHAIDADGGRGLEIVSLLSDRWGFYRPEGGGKAVWAAVAIGRQHPTEPPG